MSEKKPLQRKFSTIEEDLRFVKAARNRLWRTPKDTPLKQRRKAEKLAQLDEFIAQLEPQVEAERASRKEGARLAQIKANGERHEAERLAAESREFVQQPQEEPQQRIAFNINGRHFIKSGDRLAEISAIRADDGSWTDKLDGERLRMVYTCPPPTPGARLRDDGEWLLPEIRPTPVPQPPKLEPSLGDIRLEPERFRSAQRAADKIKELGYQARIQGNECVVLYDSRWWLPVAEWKKKMRTVCPSVVLADL